MTAQFPMGYSYKLRTFPVMKISTVIVKTSISYCLKMPAKGLFAALGRKLGTGMFLGEAGVSITDNL